MCYCKTMSWIKSITAFQRRLLAEFAPESTRDVFSRPGENERIRRGLRPDSKEPPTPGRLLLYSDVSRYRSSSLALELNLELARELIGRAGYGSSCTSSGRRMKTCSTSTRLCLRLTRAFWGDHYDGFSVQCG